PSQVVGTFQSAGREHVEPAVRAAAAAFETWRRTTAEERAALIHHVAGILRERKFEFSAWMVYEVGKNWAEADADIAETIDFAEFFEVLQEAGIPDGVVNFCPGSGSGFGAALVEHPQVRFIAFTGSKEVGL